MHIRLGPLVSLINDDLKIDAVHHTTPLLSPEGSLLYQRGIDHILKAYREDKGALYS